MATKFKTFRIPGLAKDIPIPADIEVQIKIIDSKRFRSYTKSTPSMLTVHDTGNPKTKADGEYQWAAAGRPGGSVGGYVGIYDAKKIIIAAPWDEDSWATATPRGNKVSRSFEMAFGGGQDFNAVMRVGAALYGGLCAALGWPPAKVIVQHNYWSGKDCPGQLRRKGLWPRFVQMTTEAKQEAEAFLNGSNPTIPTEPANEWPYDKPEKPWFWDAIVASNDAVAVKGNEHWYRTGLLVQATKDTPRYAIADLESKRRVGPDILAGTVFRLQACGFSGNGDDIGTTDWMTRIDLADVEVVADLFSENAA